MPREKLTLKEHFIRTTVSTKEREPGNSEVTILVCGYGMPYGRTDAELVGLERFRDDVAKYSQTLGRRPTRMIFVGKQGDRIFVPEHGSKKGQAVTIHENVSEAEASLQYFQSRTKKMDINLEGVEMLTQNTAQNTVENIIFGIKEVLPKLQPGSELHIVCDLPRDLRVMIHSLLANILADLDLKLKIVPLERQDVHPKSNRTHQTLAIIRDITKLKYWVHLYKLRQINRDNHNPIPLASNPFPQGPG